MTHPPSFSSQGGRGGAREAEPLGTFGEGGCGDGGVGRGGNRDGVMSEDDWGHQGVGRVSQPC